MSEQPLTYRDMVRLSHRLPVRERTHLVMGLVDEQRATGTDALLLRQVLGPMGREVLVRDWQGRTQPMLMFGSNNYLGFASHPRIRERVLATVAEMGVGVGGPPLLNGYSHLHRELEMRLAALEGTEEAMLFGSGYSANLGLMSALPGRRDLVVFDSHSHASLIDGLKLGGVANRSFPHADAAALDADLAAHRAAHRDVFVCAEGVYSMDGDIARLDEIAPVARRHEAFFILDDAHGTGVTGPGGHGTAAAFAPEHRPDAVVGTFSKSFAVSGGFVAAPRSVVEMMRYWCRAYMFSASLAPSVVAAVLAGMDVLEEEPEIHARLMANTRYLANGLMALGLPATAETPIFPIRIPMGVEVRKAAHAFHDRGLFVNHVEHPAVQLREQRFRISLSADHTTADLDRLLTAVAEITAPWKDLERAVGDGYGTIEDDEPLPEMFEGGF